MGSELNKNFSKEDIQMANRYMKRLLTPLICREMRIKTTTRYHLTSVRIATIKKTLDNKYWGGCGETGTLLCWGMYLGKGMEVPQKVKNRTTI